MSKFSFKDRKELHPTSTLKDEKEPIYIKVLDFLARFYERSNIDYAQLRLIVAAKMKMDGRQSNPVLQNQSKSSEKNSFFRSLVFYCLISCLMVIVLFAGDNWMVQYSLFYAYLFLMLTSTLIASFSNALLDNRDQIMIGTRPVSKKTLNASRTTHVTIYLIALTFALAGPTIAATFFLKSILAGLLLIVLTIVFSLWILLFTLTIYAMILNRFDSTKLKNIIAYSQIGLSIFTIIGYQLIGRVGEFVDFSIVYRPENWHFILFPLWFAAPIGMLQEGITMYYFLFTLLMILVSILLIVYMRNHAEKMENDLQKLSSANDPVKAKNRWMDLTRRFLCREKTENAYYTFTWKTIQNEREFKTRIYPSLAVSVLLPFIMVFNSLSSGLSFNELRGQTNNAYFVYFSLLMVPSIASSMKYSAHYKGSWIFQMIPKEQHGSFLKAAGKAVWVRLITPIFLFMGISLTVLFGLDALSIILNGFLVTTIVFFIYLKSAMTSFPFSQKTEVDSGAEGCLMSFMIAIVAAVTAGGNWALYSYVPYGSWLLLIVLLTVTFYLLFSPFKKIRLD